MKVLFFSTRGDILKKHFVTKDNEEVRSLKSSLKEYIVLGVAQQEIDVVKSDDDRIVIFDRYLRLAIEYLERNKIKWDSPIYFFLHDDDFGGRKYLRDSTNYFSKIRTRAWLMKKKGVEKFVPDETLRKNVCIVMFQHEMTEPIGYYLLSKDIIHSDESTSLLIDGIEEI